jgi:hypothetical protein
MRNLPPIIYGDKKVLPVATNLRDFGTRFVDWGILYHGAAMASVGLKLEDVLRRIHIPSTYRSDQLFPWGSHPALDSLWSTEHLSFSHYGCEARRIDKVCYIAQFPIVMNTLRVCMSRPFSGSVYNCGLCEKCVRTMVALHIAGKLQKCTTFPASIDLRVLRSIPTYESSARPFLKELVADLGSSEIDLAMKFALEKALSKGTRQGSRRTFFSSLLPTALRALPLMGVWVRLWRALRRSPPSSILELLGFPW